MLPFQLKLTKNQKLVQYLDINNLKSLNNIPIIFCEINLLNHPNQLIHQKIEKETTG